MKNLSKLLAVAVLFVLMFCLINCSKAKFNIGKDEPQIEIQKCVQLSEKKNYSEAVECFEIFKSRFANTPYGAEAELAIADNYFNNKEYLLAADAYLIYTKLHPTSAESDYAHYRLGLSYLKETPKAIDRDQQHLDEAIHYLRIAATVFPGSPYQQASVDALKDARFRVAKRNFYIGRFYFRTGEYQAAIPRFLVVINDYPETNLVTESLYKLILASGNLRRVSDAKLFFSKLTMEHPNDPLVKKAEAKMFSFVKKYGEGEPSTIEPTNAGGSSK